MYVWIVFVFLILMGCSETTSDGTPMQDPGDTSQVPLNDLHSLSDSVFQDDSIYTIQLTIDSAHLAYLNEDPAREEYVPSEAQMMGMAFDSVGVRYKGASGSLRLCLDDNNNIICNKLSLKLKFSEYDKSHRLLGLKKINLHAMNRDGTKMKEKLAYSIYREEGIPAPRTSWARVLINGVDMGLYSLIEQIDGRFTKFNWPEDGDGNLYKETYPNSTDPDYYTQGQKTNEEVLDATRMLEFQAAINQAQTKGDLDDFIDMDAWVTYLAIDRAITNWDGITTFYCGGEVCSSHNFYLYLNADIVTPVIWDLDGAFGVEPLWTDLWDWDQEPESCEPQTFNGSVSLQAAQCDPLLAYTKRFYHQEYLDALGVIYENHFASGKLVQELEQWRAYLRPELSSELDISAWESDVDKLKAAIEVLGRKAELESQGEAWEAFAFNPTKKLSFESYTSAELSSQVTGWASPGSSMSSSKDDQDQLRIQYSAQNNGTQAWGAWMNVSIPLDTTRDLNDFDALFLNLSSEVGQSWSISIESSSYTNANGPKFTWEFTVGESANPVGLNLGDLTMGTWDSSNEDVNVEDVLATATSLIIVPVFRNRGSDGLFPEGEVETGALMIQDMEFLSL